MAFTGNYVTNTYKNGLNTGLFDLGTGTTQVFKIALYTNEATLNATTPGYTYTQAFQGEVLMPFGSGYTAGGKILTISQVPTVGSSGTTSYYSFANVSWSAAITARGALIYKYDGSTNPAMIVLDFGSDKISTTTFTVQFPAATNTTAIIRIS
jgi:hypothetical protein